MESSSESKNKAWHKSDLTQHHGSSTPKSPSRSQSSSTGDNATTQNQAQPYQQQAYFNAAETNDPFFQPEGEANRTNRLNNHLDTLIGVIQFPDKTGAGTSPVRGVQRPREPSVGKAIRTQMTETKAKSKGKRLAESERHVKMTDGTGREKVKGKEAVIHDNGD